VHYTVSHAPRPPRSQQLNRRKCNAALQKLQAVAAAARQREPRAPEALAAALAAVGAPISAGHYAAAAQQAPSASESAAGPQSLHSFLQQQQQQQQQQGGFAVAAPLAPMQPVALAAATLPLLPYLSAGVPPQPFLLLPVQPFGSYPASPEVLQAVMAGVVAQWAQQIQQAQQFCASEVINTAALQVAVSAAQREVDRLQQAAESCEAARHEAHHRLKKE